MDRVLKKALMLARGEAAELTLRHVDMAWDELKPEGSA